MSIKVLIGGSPCTHWSIAQKNNRETTAEGIGWELFKNYLIAKEKFKPDFFLYENNKSAAQAIKEQIAQELGVGVDPNARFTYINSALVSAQNRQRFYVTNFGDIEQPKDRCVLLKDILETGESWTEKSYALTTRCQAAIIEDTLRRSDEAKAVRQQYESGELRHGFHELSELHPRTDGKSNTLSTMLKDNPICEPVRVGDLPNEQGKISGSQATRIYAIEGKSVNLVANGGGQGAKTGLYAIPVDTNVPMLVKEATNKGYTEIHSGECVDLTMPNSKTRRGRNMAERCNCLTTTTAYYQYLGAIPCEYRDGIPIKATSQADGKEYPVYEVLSGIITIKGKQYPIKLIDGYYIIRKLTVKECCRLQTMPDDYCKAVSPSQAYKGLGNGWTAEVIIHLLNHALKDIPRDEEIVVLSLYDGIGTGRYCLEKMGFTNVKYHAYEIDKFPMEIANDNYPDIVQHGDAFVVRDDDWQAPQTSSEWLTKLLEVV